MKINDYSKSREQYLRACKVIPSGIYGHQGPAEGCYTPIEAWPMFSSRAQGSYFWDVDGNRMIDYMCGYGPNILGYHDPDVDEAARIQRGIEDCVTVPSTKMIDFAELLVDTVATADWAFFAKNGNDVTTLAVLTARAYTHRKKIVFFKGYYHGVSPWTQKMDYSGILEEDVMHNIYVDWNDYDALAEVFDQHKGEIAAVISQPYMHGNFQDNVMPADGFWQKVRKLCTDNSTVLIVDDVRAGWRMDLKGSDHYFGFEADLICFCKALANGYNVSALCGKEHLKNTVSGMSYTGSYWLSAVPFAAGIACIEKMKRLDIANLLQKKGEQLKRELESAANEYGYNMIVSGATSLPYLRIAESEDLILHQRWVAECVRRGVFFTSHHNHFMNAAMTDEDIRLTGEVAREAFRIIRDGK